MKKFLFSALALAASAAHAAVPASYTIVDYGLDSPYPAAISSNGQYIVGTTAQGTTDIVLMANGVSKALTAMQGAVVGVNNSGVVATLNIGNIDYYKAGTITSLDPFPKDASNNTSAAKLNDLGQVAGSGIDPSYADRGFIMDATGKTKVLAPLTSYTISAALGLNNAGDAVGYSAKASSYNSEATLWKADGTIVNLNSLMPSDGAMQAMAISNNGLVVGFGVYQGSYDITGWVSNYGKTFTELGGFIPSYVSNTGIVVGQSSYEAYTPDAIWTEATGVLPLMDLIKDSDPLKSALIIDGAVGIDDFGNILVAAHTLESDTRAYLLKSSAPVPEPTTMALMGLGLVGVAGVARRRRPVQAA